MSLLHSFLNNESLQSNENNNNDNNTSTTIGNCVKIRGDKLELYYGFMKNL